MADAQTTGGYAVIAVVITADMPLAAQLVPGDSLRWKLVTLEQAKAAARSRRDDLDWLWGDNEITGVPI